MNPTLKKWLKAAATVALAALMFAGISRLLRTFDTDEVLAGFHAVPPGAIAGALGLLVLLYASYVVQELFAARFAGLAALGAPRIAAAALVSRSLATIGMGTISGFALRLRVYGGWGVGAADVTRLSLYNEVAYYIGIVSSVAVVFTFTDVPAVATGSFALPGPLLGAAAAAVVAAYLAVSLRRRAPIKIRSFEIPSVRGSLLVAQLALPLVQLAIGGALVWACLPASAGLSLPETIAVSFLGGLAGSASQVPGGLGVFETLVLQFVPPAAHPAALAGLLVRRVIVNLVPMAIGAVLLVGLEAVRSPARRSEVWTQTAATAMAAVVFASGVVLIVAASIGGPAGPFAELGTAGHGVVFALGFATLSVARDLHLGHPHAWRAAIALTAARAVVALAAGPEVPGLVASLVILGLLFAGRSSCRVPRPDPDDPIAWWTSLVVAMLGVGWLALTADPGSVTRGAIVRAAGVIVAASLLAGFATARRRRSTASSSSAPP
jgi:phosphatidylglycerol lysyltransferase